MKRVFLVLAFCLIFLSVDGFAQITSGATKFTSVYTNLTRNCRTIKGDPEGTDEAFDCPGIGGYRITVSYAASAQMINIETSRKERAADIPMQGLEFDHTKIKVEWRLANGAPFAVVIRVFKYGEEKINDYDIFGKKIGEQLRVVGLKGFEHINFSVDAATPDANREARELADAAYAAIKNN